MELAKIVARSPRRTQNKRMIHLPRCLSTPPGLRGRPCFARECALPTIIILTSQPVQPSKQLPNFNCRARSRFACLSRPRARCLDRVLNVLQARRSVYLQTFAMSNVTLIVTGVGGICSKINHGRTMSVPTPMLVNVAGCAAHCEAKASRPQLNTPA